MSMPMQSLHCPKCDKTVAHLADGPYQNSYLCDKCGKIVIAQIAPFRFDKPACPNCSNTLSRTRELSTVSDPPDEAEDPYIRQYRVPCPECGHKYTQWVTGPYRINWGIPDPPEVGSLVHGELMRTEWGDWGLRVAFTRAHLVTRTRDTTLYDVPLELKVLMVIPFKIPGLMPPEVWYEFVRELSWDEF